MTCREQGVHIGRSLCLLCRQPANIGVLILDLNQSQLTVPKSRNPCSTCLDTPSPEIWFHKECYNILECSYTSSEKPTFDDLQRFADAVKPLYKPLDKEQRDTASVWEGLFSRYTKNIMENSFRLESFNQLPVELQFIILDFVGPCWYLIVLGETRRLVEQLRNAHESQPEQLSLARDIYISRTTYQGNSYISRMSNTPLESRLLDIPNQQHLKLPDHIRKVILSKDHVGLRRVQFVDQNSDPSPDESPWYEVLEVTDLHVEVNVSFDGLFVSSIRLSSDESHDTPRTWSSPYPPRIKPRNIYRIRAGCRLDYVKLDAEVQGLLVCCSAAWNIGIHGFSSVSPAFEKFVELVRRRSRRVFDTYWMFFPINDGEAIEAAWIRQIKGSNTIVSHPTLVGGASRSGHIRHPMYIMPTSFILWLEMVMVLFQGYFMMDLIQRQSMDALQSLVSPQRRLPFRGP